VLFFFNLLPASPLDGGSVARGLIPARWVDTWDEYAKYAPFVVMAFILVSPLGKVITWPAHWIASHLYHGVALVFGVSYL